MIFAFSSPAVMAQSITDEILQCEANRATGAILNANVVRCPATLSDADEKTFCDDPVKYACSKNPRGRIYDSKCSVSLNNPADSARTPESIKVHQQLLEAEKKFYFVHKNECSASMPRENCETKIRTKFPSELASIRKKVVYSPERMKRFKDAFTEVQNTLLEMITTSTQLSTSIKSLLIQKIQKTQLADPLANFSDSCTVMGSSENGETGLFNSGDVDGIREVNICAGRMASLDRMNESDLLFELGHEMTHSIDPCALDQVGLRHPDLGISGDLVFGSMSKCIRGGDGARGCDNGVLHCNAPESIKEFCESRITNDRTAGDRSAQMGDCLKFAEKVPNCALSGPGSDGGLDLSDYRKIGHPIEQIQESFSDFLGGQVMAKILQKKSANLPEADAAQAKRDALFSVTSDFASLHGVCMSENTVDVHPPGGIRIKQSLMGNADTGKFLCPHKMDQIGCQGL